MIDNFEDETGELNAQEMEVAVDMAAKLRSNVGKKNAATSHKMIDHYLRQGIKLNGARVRKIINHIRLKGMVKNLIATSAGYYVSTNPQEIQGYIRSLEQRASAIMAMAKTFKQ